MDGSRHLMESFPSPSPPPSRVLASYLNNSLDNLHVAFPWHTGWLFQAGLPCFPQKDIRGSVPTDSTPTCLFVFQQDAERTPKSWVYMGVSFFGGTPEMASVFLFSREGRPRKRLVSRNDSQPHLLPSRSRLALGWLSGCGSHGVPGRAFALRQGGGEALPPGPRRRGENKFARCFFAREMRGRGGGMESFFGSRPELMDLSHWLGLDHFGGQEEVWLLFSGQSTQEAIIFGLGKSNALGLEDDGLGYGVDQKVRKLWVWRRVSQRWSWMWGLIKRSDKTWHNH